MVGVKRRFNESFISEDLDEDDNPGVDMGDLRLKVFYEADKYLSNIK